MHVPLLQDQFEHKEWTISMLKSNVFDILNFSKSCIHPLSIVFTFHLHKGDSYSGLKVNFSEASDKAAIKK